MELTSSAAPHKSQIIELGHSVLHLGGIVAQLRADVLIVPSTDGHVGSISDVRQGDHFEGQRQGLVGAPMVG